MKVVKVFFVKYSNTFPETKSSAQKNHGWKDDLFFLALGLLLGLWLLVLGN